MSHVGIVGAGWAGLAAAVHAIEQGHTVSLWEASRNVGGRARSQSPRQAHASGCIHDNGAHLLMSAYSETCRLMTTVGVNLDEVLLDAPLDLRLPSGDGLALSRRHSRWPAALQLAHALRHARGWSWRDRWALTRWSLKWRQQDAAESATVTQLCADLPATVMTQLIAPLCVSALNLPPNQASARLLLAVLRDTLWATPRQWRAWIPRKPLGELFPEPALDWLRQRGAHVHLGERVQRLQLTPDGVRVQANTTVDQLILAAPPAASATLARQLPHAQAQTWADIADQLPHTAIATAFAYAPGLRLQRAMLALDTADARDAQFVFDLGQLGRPAGHLAAVLSHAPTDGQGLKEHLQAQLQQALGDRHLHVKQLVLEKRATFAATPGVKRPSAKVCPKVWACGDAIEGPYPATLEGAVRSATHLPWVDLRVGAEDA